MSDGYTSLHKAVVIGNLEIVKFLINHGAQLEVCNNCGISPLALAKNMGQQEIVDYIDTVIVSAIQHDEKFSVDQISVNIRHNLSDYTAIKEVESIVTDFKEYSQDEAGKVMTDFFNQLKSYRSEFRDWVEEEIKSQYDDQKGHQSSDRVYRNIKVDVQPEDERSESIILKDTILKIERSCDNDLQGKCEAKLIIDYSTMKSLYDQAEGIDK